MTPKELYILTCRALMSPQDPDNMSILGDALADMGLTQEEQHIRQIHSALTNQIPPRTIPSTIRSNLEKDSGRGWIVRRLGVRDGHGPMLTISSVTNRRIVRPPGRSARFLSDQDRQYLSRKFTGKRIRFQMDDYAVRIPDLPIYQWYALDLSLGLERSDPRAATNTSDILQSYFGYLWLPEPLTPQQVPEIHYIDHHYAQVNVIEVEDPIGLADDMGLEEGGW
jgi:hypothetical protein